ncbi:unnamed protein product [Caenorhabditis sp. 36 PRJEB53466]|nr:unnamed protein product [Caenorhabditis sp. 36 PRJEB53466]
MKLPTRCLFLFLLLFCVIHNTAARGGGGRGGRGRGRGHSGSRGRVRAKTTTNSGVRGSSSYSGGVRSGSSGFKVGSGTSTTSNYGSSAFRMQTSVFHNHATSRGGGHPFVIIAAATPIFYDNRNYYWTYNDAKFNRTISRSNIICEYVFGTDDGELQNVTFANGTQARAFYFGCEGMVDCCGMYCCHDFHQYFELLFLFGFCLIFLGIAYYAKRREPVRDKKSDTVPLREKSPKPSTAKPAPKSAKPPQSQKPLTNATQAKPPTIGWNLNN